MVYSAEIFAESRVDRVHLESAAAAIIRLADSMGCGDPKISLKPLPDELLPLNQRGQVDRTIINGFPQDESLRLVVTGRDLGVGDDEPTNLNFVFGTSRLGRVDRKSTRLNSSHSQISYAVFCLKK